MKCLQPAAYVLGLVAALLTSSVAKADVCSLVDRETGKAFTVFDGTLYSGKPDYSAQCVNSSKIIYGSNIYTKPYDFMGLPSYDMVVDQARRAAASGQVVVLDLETWPFHWSSATDAEIQESSEKYLTTLRWFQDAAPDVDVGWYAMVPSGEYWAVQPQFGEGSDRYRRWQEFNDVASRIVDDVDTLYPTLYTSYEDREGWRTFAEGQIAEARRVAPGKKVVAFIWPQYHPSSARKYELIERDYWRFQLEVLREIADGVLVWGGWDFHGGSGQLPWDNSMPWWQETLDFISDNYQIGGVQDPSPPPNPDPQALEITNIGVEQVSNTEVKVSFSMNPPATGQTDYGTTQALGTVHGPETRYLSQHIQTIKNLAEGTTYYFKVSGGTAEGAVAESQILSFTTGSADPGPDPQPIDNIAPVSQILSPIDGESVLQSETIEVMVQADDNEKLDSLEVFINGQQRVTFVGEGPYTFGWKVDTISGSENQILAQAKDQSGNSSNSQVVVTTVDPQDPLPDPQALEISGITVQKVSETEVDVVFSMDPPATGQTDYGTTQALGTVHGPETRHLSFHSQRVKNLQEGTAYFFKVSGSTAEGAFAESGIMSFTTDSSQPTPDPIDTTPPVVEIIEPGSIVPARSSVKILVEVKDDVGLQGVDLYIDGTLKRTFSGSGTHSYNWATDNATQQRNEILVVATDLSGNEASDLLQVRKTKKRKFRLGGSDLTGAR